MLCNEKYMHCGVFTIYLMANIGLLAFAMLDGVRPSRISQGTLHSTTSSTRIILPGESFPATVAGEVSIVSFNILAPSYHWLNVEESEKDIKMQQDREHRIPSAINLAKQANADVLCLQEVEGGSMEQEQELKDILVQSSPDFLGYDSYLWTPLHPNRKGDLVGLCVAWRSKRHNIIASDMFRRGMVIQLEEVETGATFSIGNLHLPAKPSAIEGRLKTISTAIKKIEGCVPHRGISALDGAVFIVGDYNCEPHSVTIQLLETGISPHGTLRDRNYKAKVTKNAAFGFRHDFKFRSAYSKEVRDIAAPVTVSLKGRGPGCMDHIFFASTADKPRSPMPSSGGAIVGGKRKARREVARQRFASAVKESPSPLSVHCVLSTVSPEQHGRMETIVNGLPNLEAGFPSDHILIGALFAPEPFYLETVTSQFSEIEQESVRRDFQLGGVSANALRRRDSYSKSLEARRRHNVVLRELTDWLISRGAQEIIRDQPLNRWKWLDGVKGLKGKLRAPDLCCVLGESLVIVEVTIANNPDQMRREKLEKYKDLAGLLRSSPVLSGSKLTVHDTIVVALKEDGEIPLKTREDIHKLALLSWCAKSQNEDTQLFCNHLQRTFAQTTGKE